MSDTGNFAARLPRVMQKPLKLYNAELWFYMGTNKEISPQKRSSSA